MGRSRSTPSSLKMTSEARTASTVRETGSKGALVIEERGDGEWAARKGDDGNITGEQQLSKLNLKTDKSTSHRVSIRVRGTNARSLHSCCSPSGLSHHLNLGDPSPPLAHLHFSDNRSPHTHSPTSKEESDGSQYSSIPHCSSLTTTPRLSPWEPFPPPLPPPSLL